MTSLISFFVICRQHGVADGADQKYETRAAQLYRQKLRTSSTAGTKTIETPFGNVGPAKVEQKYISFTSSI